MFTYPQTFFFVRFLIPFCVFFRFSSTSRKKEDWKLWKCKNFHFGVKHTVWSRAIVRIMFGVNSKNSLRCHQIFERFSVFSFSFSFLVRLRTDIAGIHSRLKANTYFTYLFSYIYAQKVLWFMKCCVKMRFI